MSLSLLITKAKPTCLQIRLAGSCAEGEGLQQGRRALTAITRTVETVGHGLGATCGCGCVCTVTVCTAPSVPCGTLKGKYHPYSHLTAEQTETQPGYVTCPRSQHFVNLI